MYNRLWLLCYGRNLKMISITICYKDAGLDFVNMYLEEIIYRNYKREEFQINIVDNNIDLLVVLKMVNAIFYC